MVAACTSRCHASITHPVNSHTSVPVATSGGWCSGRRGRPRRRGTRCSRCATARALDPAEQEPVVAEGAVGEALPAGREAVLGGQRLPRALHQPPEGHAGRACRLAAPALHARVHERDELGVGLGALPLHEAHGGDAAPGRRRLLPRHAVRRAVGQAQAAAHAGGQFGVDQVERHGPLTVPDRPGLSRPLGVEAGLHPAVQLGHRRVERDRRRRRRRGARRPPRSRPRTGR